jgi:hypothetical protein
MALKANKDARVKKIACNADIEERITGFNPSRHLAGCQPAEIT